MKLNTDYLSLYKEIPLFCLLIIKRAFTFDHSNEVTTNNLLIVNTCLIGEFIVSVPALHDVIEKHKGGVIDILVSPPLKSIAEKIKGIRNVYIAESVFSRDIEQVSEHKKKLGNYKEMLVLRMSGDAYKQIKDISVEKLHTGLFAYSMYVPHLIVSLLLRKTPKRWADVVFEMIGSAPRVIPFDEMFAVVQEDSAKLDSLSELQTTRKKVIIHTGASWIMNHWSLEKWMTLLLFLAALGDFRFIFVGSHKEQKDLDVIVSQLPSLDIQSLIGKVNLYELLLVIKDSDYFIGIDSGPRNMANIVGTPSITLLGPGPHLYTPRNSEDIIIDRSHGRGLTQRFIKTNNFSFIEQIQPEDVLAAFKSDMQKGRV